LSPGNGDELREHREWLLSFVPAVEPFALVDLGCGDGVDLSALAVRYANPATQLVGVDVSVAATRAAQAFADLDRRIQVICARLDDRLPFDDRAFDVVYSNNLLECIGDQSAFVAEVARILHPGGTVVAAHWDWDTQLFDAADRALVRRLMEAFADWQQPWMDHAEPWLGRRLWGLFSAAGRFRGGVHARTLVETTFAPGSYGYNRAHDLEELVERGTVSADDYERFLSEQRRLDEQRRYFYSLTEFVYVGQRAS
jgi:SAM-dependent methyltransferase